MTEAAALHRTRAPAGIGKALEEAPEETPKILAAAKTDAERAASGADAVLPRAT
ncbi:hypothetical protein [Streptomyces sp. NPDC051567]|uniref:hypothetical protein n=1 Tax=Streptomyces sp. NPDC051567 TaxID=3365660 RepID=UPI00379AB3D6